MQPQTPQRRWEQKRGRWEGTYLQGMKGERTIGREGTGNLLRREVKKESMGR